MPGAESDCQERVPPPTPPWFYHQQNYTGGGGGFVEEYYQRNKTEILNNLNSFTHCTLRLSFLCDRLKMTLKNTNNSMNEEYVMSHINLIDKQVKIYIHEFIKNESKPYVLK